MKAYQVMRLAVEKLIVSLEQDVAEIQHEELSNEKNMEYDYHLGRKEAKEYAIELLKQILEDC